MFRSITLKYEIFNWHEQIERGLEGASHMTELGRTVTAYLHYSNPRNLMWLTTSIRKHFNDIDHGTMVDIVANPDELIREMTKMDLQPLFKDIDNQRFHFNVQALLWVNTTQSFSFLDPFVMQYKDCYPYLLALFRHIKGL